MSATSPHRAPDAGGVCTADGHCVTCSDAADPMRVVAIDPADIAVCEDEHGARWDVMVDLVAPIAHGEMLLVHAGVAIARLGEVG